MLRLREFNNLLLFIPVKLMNKPINLELERFKNGFFLFCLTLTLPSHLLVTLWIPVLLVGHLVHTSVHPCFIFMTTLRCPKSLIVSQHNTGPMTDEQRVVPSCCRWMEGMCVYIGGGIMDRRSLLTAGPHSFIQGLTLILSFIAVIIIQFSYSNW